MLLKISPAEKRLKVNGNTRQRGGTGNMKLIAGGNSLNARLPRKTVRGFATKRTSAHLRLPQGREDVRVPIDPCDNSNDSGLGFDQHLDAVGAVHAALRLTEREHTWDVQHPNAKRKKLDIKLETDDANDNFSFSHAMSKSHKTGPQSGNVIPDCLMPSRGSVEGTAMHRAMIGGTSNGASVDAAGNTGSTARGSIARLPSRTGGITARRAPGPDSLSSPVMGQSRDGRVQLQIASQPEQQHRARYQTEGSRGAVKDRSGNGFPVVKLMGYSKPATLQVFIGTDMGRVAPHMFYQACKVSGKNSTPCVEKKIDGTVVIEVDFDPAKDMTVTCDCVGILKERNVDVEHRFPDQSETRNKKKSTRCRMVFRTTITHPDGSTEVLQTTSHPIVCTQPPGVPEICKKSLTVASCTGGMELFILGKNFLKDTRVIFQTNDVEPVWEESVQPDKEFLQQTHLVCIVPPYQRCDILEPVTVRLLVTSSGKTSEPHSFTYMPATNPVLQPAAAEEARRRVPGALTLFANFTGFSGGAVGTPDLTQSCLNLAPHGISHGCVDVNRVFSKPPLGPPATLVLSGTPSKPPTPLLPPMHNQFLAVESSSVQPKKDLHTQMRLWSSMPLVGDSTKTEDMKSKDDEQSKVLGLKMMPPPPPPLLPLVRRVSSNVLLMPEATSLVPSTALKTEVLDESSQESTQLSPEELKGIDLRMKPGATVSDLLSTQSPSLATFRRFVSNPSDAPLPTQSGQSVEKYLSHIENPSVVKVGEGGGARGSGGGTNPLATVNAITTVTPSTTTSPPETRSVAEVQNLPNNEHCNTERTMEFNSPVMFGQSQTSSDSLITSSLTSSVTEAQKISFNNDMNLTGIYSSPSIVDKNQQKTRLMGQNIIQDTINTRLLETELNTIVSASQQKDNPLPGLCSSQPLPAALLPQVPNSALNTFNSSSNNSKSSPLTISVLGTVGDSSRMMNNNTSLLFNNGNQHSPKSILTPTEVSPKEDNTCKVNNHPSTTSLTSSTQIEGLGTSTNLLSSSGTSSLDCSSINMTAQPSTISENLLAVVTQAESSLITGTSDTRLDALVSSAIESRILEANSQNQAREKLNIYSSSESMLDTVPPQTLINSVPSENSILGSQTQVSINETFVTSQSTTSSQIHVQEMSLNTALPGSTASTFSLNALHSSETSDQLTKENLILTNSVTAPFNTHLLNTNANSKVTETSLSLSGIQEQSLNLEPVASCGTSHMVLNNVSGTSPIAMKNMILSSTNATTESNMLNANVSQNTQILAKNLLSSSQMVNGDECITNAGHSSPIAMKTMMLASPIVNETSVMNSSLDVKNILASTSLKESVTLPSTTSHCTSPIAVKKIILESASVISNSHSDPRMDISSQSADCLITSVPNGSIFTEKLDALVESTASKHILSSSPVQSSPTTSTLNLQGEVCVSTNTLPLTTRAFATILGNNVPTTLPNSSTLGRETSPLISESERALHNAVTVSSIENQNVALSSQSLQNSSSTIIPNQSESVSESSLMTLFPGENSNSVKNQHLESVSAVQNACSTLLNQNVSVFEQQSNVSVHSLLNPTQSGIETQTLSHSVPFSTSNSSASSLLTSTPCSLEPKMVCTPTSVQEGHTQERLLDQVLMNLAAQENTKTQMSTITSQEKLDKDVNNPKYGPSSSVECKIVESSSSKTCSVLPSDVQTVHLPLSKNLQMTELQPSLPEHEKEKQKVEKEKIETTSAPAITVSSLTTARLSTKDTAVVTQAPTQKKMEEGIVPQELAQMSESDLLSYINPSCFDQV